MPVLEEDVDELVLEARDPDGTHVAHGPLAPFRRGASATGAAEKHAAAVESLAMWSFDGAPPIEASTLCKVIAVATLQALSPERPHGDGLADLRALLDLMARLDQQGALQGVSGAAVLKSDVRKALRLRRQLATGAPPDVDAAALVDELAALAPSEVPEIRTTW